MAVRNEYIDTNLSSGYLSDAVNSGGAQMSVIVKTFEIAAADDDASIFRLARIGTSDILLRATIMCDAITGGTDYDLGLYNPTVAGNTGAVVDKDCFMDGQTLATATKTIDGLQTVAIEYRGKEIWELLYATSILTTNSDPKKTYDIALTANTIGTAAGTVTVILEILHKA